MHLPRRFPLPRPRPTPVSAAFDELVTALWGDLPDDLPAPRPLPVEPPPPNVVNLDDYRARRHKQKEQ